MSAYFGFSQQTEMLFEAKSQGKGRWAEHVLDGRRRGKEEGQRQQRRSLLQYKYRTEYCS